MHSQLNGALRNPILTLTSFTSRCCWATADAHSSTSSRPSTSAGLLAAEAAAAAVATGAPALGGFSCVAACPSSPCSAVGRSAACDEAEGRRGRVALRSGGTCCRRD